MDFKIEIKSVTEDCPVCIHDTDYVGVAHMKAIMEKYPELSEIDPSKWKFQKSWTKMVLEKTYTFKEVCANPILTEIFEKQNRLSLECMSFTVDRYMDWEYDGEFINRIVKFEELVDYIVNKRHSANKRQAE